MGKQELLLEYLQNHPSGITSLEAIRYLGDGRLSDTVLKLRRKGYVISTNMVEVNNSRGTTSTVARYVLLPRS